jgi:hypothetical protein
MSRPRAKSVTASPRAPELVPLPHDIPRHKVYKEILDTEQTYVDNLLKLDEVFVQPLLARASWTVVRNPLVAIFLSNVEILLYVHSKFLADVREAVESLSFQVADVLASYARVFKLYHSYASCYEFAIPIIMEKHNSEPYLNAFILKAQEELGGTMLSSLAILPIQRIPRYILLIKELIKITPKSHSEYNRLEIALQRLETEAQELNEVIRARQHSRQIAEVEKQFSNKISLAEKNRKILKIGTLNAKAVSKSGHVSLTYLLFNDLLIIAAPSSTGLAVYQAIDLRFLTQDSVRENGKFISIRFRAQNTALSFISESEREEFKVALIEGIRKCNAIYADLFENNSKLSSTTTVDSERGDTFESNEESIGASRCYACSNRFTMFKRRQYCGKCGNAVCNDCSEKKIYILNLNEVVKVCDICAEQLRKDQDRNISPSFNSLESLEFNFNKLSTTEDLLRELLRTEHEFLRRIDIFLNIFILPMLNYRINNALEMEPQIAIFFNNVELISILNKEFGSSLSARLETWNSETTLIGSVFVKFAPLFRLYGQYARYSSFVLLAFESSEFSEAVKAGECHPKCVSLHLKASQLLQLPLERIPTYERFIYEYIQRLPDSCKDIPHLEESLERIRDCNVHINEAREEQENLKILHDLEEKFKGSAVLVQPGRRLVKGGHLFKVNRKGAGQRYYFHLFNDALSYSKETLVGFQLHRMMDNYRLKVIDNSDSDSLRNSFTLVSADKSFVVYASDAETKFEWLQAFCSLASESSSIPDSGVSSRARSHSVKRRSLILTSNSQSPSRRRYDSATVRRGSTSGNTTEQVDEKVERKQRNSKTSGKIQSPQGGKEIDLTRAPVLESEKKARVCNVCCASFRLVLRINHCRCCGEAVCQNCSKREVCLPHSQGIPVRTCDTCYNLLVINDLVIQDGNGKKAMETVKLELDENFVTSSDEDTF